MKTKIKDRIRGTIAVAISTLTVAAVLLVPTKAEAWHLHIWFIAPAPPFIFVTWSSQ
jgi:hypothetical protein